MSVSKEEKEAIRQELLKEQQQQRLREQDEAAKGCATFIFIFIVIMVGFAIYDFESFIQLVGAFGQMLK